MEYDEYLIELYYKIGNTNKSNFIRFISNAEKSYYEINQSLRNIDELITSSKWNDDIKSSLELYYDNFSKLVDKCSKFSNDIVVPLSEEVELLSSNLNKYYNLYKKGDIIKNSFEINAESKVISLESFYNNIPEWIDNFELFRNLVYKFYNVYDNSYINSELIHLYNEVRLKYNKNKFSNSIDDRYFNTNVGYGYSKYRTMNRNGNNEIQELIKRNLEMHFIPKDQYSVDHYVNKRIKEASLKLDTVAKECYENIKKINILLGNNEVIHSLSRKIESYNTKIQMDKVRYTVTNSNYITSSYGNGKNITKLKNGGKVLSSVVGGLGALASTGSEEVEDNVAVESVYDFNKEEVTKDDNTNINNVSRIHFIGTGSSDAILVESNGHYGLIDASNGYNDGTVWSVSDSKESVDHVITYLKNHNVTKLDFVIATHNHCDHIGGMPEISKTFVQAGMPYYYRPYTKTYEDVITDWDNSGYASRAISAMRSAGASMINVTGSYPLLKIGDFEIQLLNTETLSEEEKRDDGLATSENYNSIVESVTYKGRHKTLLASDMCYYDEMKVANKVGSVQILKMGHHSYNSSTGIDFIDKITPKYVIITNNNKNDHFAYGSMYYMQTKLGTRIMHTGSNDAIVVDYNDASYTVNPDSAIPTFSATDNGNWKTVNGRDLMYYKNGSPVYEWEKINNEWYYFSHGGVVQTGWQQILYDKKKNWYYFNGNGVMQKGFQKLDWNGSTNWYYFDEENGAMKTEWNKITYNNKTDWYYFDKNGAMQTGWQELKWDNEKNWYYFNNDGAMQTGWQKISDKYYYLGDNGAMRTGWQEVDKKWYYLNDDGVMQTGWQELTWGNSKNWYYFESSGEMVVNTKKTIDGKEYSFDSNGVWIQ